MQTIGAIIFGLGSLYALYERDYFLAVICVLMTATILSPTWWLI